MTDPSLTPDELLADEARADTTPPDADSTAAGLPENVPDGRVHDEDDPGVQEVPVTQPKED